MSENEVKKEDGSSIPMDARMDIPEDAPGNLEPNIPQPEPEFLRPGVNKSEGGVPHPEFPANDENKPEENIPQPEFTNESVAAVPPPPPPLINAAEDKFILDEPVVIDDSAVTNESVAEDEPAVTGEPVITDEPATGDVPAAGDELQEADAPIMSKKQLRGLVKEAGMKIPGYKKLSAEKLQKAIHEYVPPVVVTDEPTADIKDEVPGEVPIEDTEEGAPNEEHKGNSEIRHLKKVVRAELSKNYAERILTAFDTALKEENDGYPKKILLGAIKHILNPKIAASIAPKL